MTSTENFALAMGFLNRAMGQPHEHRYHEGRCLVCSELDPTFAQSFSEWLDANNDSITPTDDSHNNPEWD